MALLYNYCGMHETPQTAVRIVVKGDANGLIQAVIDGTTYDGETIDTTTYDGLAKIDITGLTAGTTYDVGLYIGGVFQKNTKAKTLPTDNIKMIFASCLSNGAYQHWAQQAKARNPDIIYGAGDFNYETINTTNYQQDAVITCNTNALDIDNRYTRFNNFFILTEVQDMYDTGVQFLFMWDDHELFNAWSFDLNQGDIAALAHPVTITAPPTIQEVVDIWRAHLPYLESLHYGNPTNPDSPTGELPDGTATTDAAVADFPPLYTRINIGDIVQFYILDVQMYRTSMLDADNGVQSPIVKTTLGANQRSWVKTQGAASTASFNIIMMGKYVWELGDEGVIGQQQWDRWNLYPSERADIAADVDTNWPGTTFSVSGDVHLPNTNDNGELWNFCICPAGIGNVKRDADYGTNTKQVWRGAQGERGKYLGEIDISSTQVDITLIDIMRDRRYQTISFDTASNRPVTPAQKTIGS